MKGLFRWKAVLLVCVCLLLGVQSAAARTKELRLWGLFNPATSSLGEALSRLANEYSRQNPEVKVVYEPVGDLITKLPISIAAGTGPDMTSTAGGIAPDRSNLSQLFVALTPYYRRDRVDDSYIAEALAWMSWDDVSYAAPWSLDFNFPLLINNELLLQSGVRYDSIDSIDGLWEASRRVTAYDAEGNVRTVAMRPWTTYGCNQGLITWALAFGGQISDGVWYTLDNPAVIAAMHWLREYGEVFGRQGGAPAIEQIPMDPRRVAIQPHVLAVIQRMTDIEYPDIDFRSIPFPSTTPGKPSVWLGGQWLAIVRGSRYPDEAWSFIRWATTSLEAAGLQRGLVLAGTREPYARGIYRREQVTTFDRLHNEYIRLVDHIRFLKHPTMYHWGEMENLVRSIVISKTVAPESALEEHNRELNARIRALLEAKE